MASSRRKNKRRKLMSIYKTTMKLKAKHPEAEIKDCIKTATQLHNQKSDNEIKTLKP